ncbi:uncharacterized protein AMSG_07697 [Thecamonas trahens ATCC 50062]|uniref:F-box domain-containing protein n=1 Tax=Thecamonas trahens ATCC 50062 TaxID=461836 RepID=A0A0L0DGN3_THETB|nr:hypothetical protein AMSG_07697 [Thecamonas trahens ATCC 50062]KNC51499.1 hypothetical protein AMSG_07697 [Thecamonas trahens ATCC 50062]|eukprot:XP_013756157.1 hypothetical protein AMSG_07697 [Thecamonas trahens ATCC 50062]
MAATVAWLSKAGPADYLPRELMFMIFSYLPGTHLAKAAQVCSTWQSLAYDPLLWRRLLMAAAAPVVLAPNPSPRKAFITLFRTRRIWRRKLAGGSSRPPRPMAKLAAAAPPPGSQAALAVAASHEPDPNRVTHIAAAGDTLVVATEVHPALRASALGSSGPSGSSASSFRRDAPRMVLAVYAGGNVRRPVATELLPVVAGSVCVAQTARGATVVVGCGGSMYAYMLASGKTELRRIGKLVAHLGRIIALAASAGRVASAGSEGSISVWDAPRGTMLFRHEIEAGFVGLVGSKVVVGEPCAAAMTVLDGESGELLAPAALPDDAEGRMVSWCCVPGAPRVAASTTRGQVVVFDVTDGAPVVVHSLRARPHPG